MNEATRNWRQVAGDLREIVETRFVIDDPETLRPYECDGLSVYREMPRVVVIPDSVEQVLLKALAKPNYLRYRGLSKPSKDCVWFCRLGYPQRHPSLVYCDSVSLLEKLDICE